ncbi:MAG: type IA DNA topoisomerase, partial [Lachnospiraceae bacterium]|nr:type IA DNA topoisomerase [Lachnospiraceae bacterium]
MAGKSLFIAEKPSVAEEFAKVVGKKLSRYDGYREGDNCVVTWCFGHLVTMSYPEVYDVRYKRWRLDTLPFLPKKYRYEIINSPSVRKQFATVKTLLNRPDVETIYVCTDSGREGEYIYRLVRQMAGVHGKDERRVWINSQTEEEIRRGIREAKPLSAYDNLSDAAYLRAKEDYLMGINFSRLLTLKYGDTMASFLHKKHCVVAVGRVMTCVLGMVTKREQEIRNFKKTPFYRVVALMGTTEEPEIAGKYGPEEPKSKNRGLELEWRAVEGSRYFASPLLYKENGFKEESSAKKLIEELYEVAGISGKTDQIIDSKNEFPANGTLVETSANKPLAGVVDSVSRRKEKKNAPLLYNLAELQNECAKLFKIAPDETLAIAQELYEKKLITYPRTDARVLSSAIAGEIQKNLSGLSKLPMFEAFTAAIFESGSYKTIKKTRYVNDAAITDHYAIIPTGVGLPALPKLSPLKQHVYEVIARRFLAIFFPPAVYQKTAVVLLIGGERFFANDRWLVEPGYLSVMEYSFSKKKGRGAESEGGDSSAQDAFLKQISGFRKGKKVIVDGLSIRQGETSPPKRYTTGSIILAMENAGNLIEDEALREQIKGSGIGTSATRAEILDKL